MMVRKGKLWRQTRMQAEMSHRRDDDRLQAKQRGWILPFLTALTGTNLTNASVSDIWLPDLRRNNQLMFKLPSLSCFLVAVPVN